MIFEADVSVLDAFLARELDDYRWKEDGTELIRKSVCFQHLKKKFFGAEISFPSGREVIIQSMSNMGLVNRTLSLPHKNWSFEGRDIYVRLGPTPKSMGISQKPSPIA